MFTDIRERYGDTELVAAGVAWNAEDAVFVSWLAFRGTMKKEELSSVLDIVEVVGRNVEPGREGMIDDLRERVGMAVK
jgi:hypothetical protein